MKSLNWTVDLNHLHKVLWISPYHLGRSTQITADCIALCSHEWTIYWHEFLWQHAVLETKKWAKHHVSYWKWDFALISHIVRSQPTKATLLKLLRHFSKSIQLDYRGKGGKFQESIWTSCTKIMEGKGGIFQFGQKKTIVQRE